MALYQDAPLSHGCKHPEIKLINIAMNKFFSIVMLIGAVSLIGVASADVERENHEAFKSIPPIINDLLLVSDEKKAGYSKIDDSSLLVQEAKRNTGYWIDSVINKRLLFSDEVKVDFSKREGVDVVDHSWSMHGYTFNVVQTSSVYCMKVTPHKIDVSRLQGEEKVKKYAKETTVAVFADSFVDRGWQFEKDVIKDFPDLIAGHTFKEERLKSWKRGDERIELLSLPTREVSKEKIWYKKVSCYFDGDSIVYFFLKENRGSVILSYDVNMDKKWFVEPRKIKLPPHLKLEEPSTSK